MGIFGSDTKRTWNEARFEGELKMVLNCSIPLVSYRAAVLMTSGTMVDVIVHQSLSITAQTILIPFLRSFRRK